MKTILYAVPWFFVGMLLVLWLHTQSLLEKSWEREKQWSMNVDKALAAGESCHKAFDSLYTSFLNLERSYHENP